jgi:hypothetical protein
VGNLVERPILGAMESIPSRPLVLVEQVFQVNPS